MNHEDQGKKTSPAEKLPAGKDDKAPVPGKPAALSDADLDNVAGGIYELSIFDRWGNKIAAASPLNKK